MTSAQSAGPQLFGTLKIVGCGLLGVSAALAARSLGLKVSLADASPHALAIAVDRGAGEPHTDAVTPDLILVCTPPDVAAATVVEQLRAHSTALVSDVTSIKSRVVTAVLEQFSDADALPALSRFVPGHPMAGRERSGGLAARADLFQGRPWVLCPPPVSGTAEPDPMVAMEAFVRALGAVPTQMSADEHDQAVAAVSHLPQVAASLVAGRLIDIPESALGIAGAGLRDLTRIADSDPGLWTQILRGNASSLVPLLRALRQDVDALLAGLEPALNGSGDAVAGTAAVAGIISAGNQGRERIPGKHGAPQVAYATFTVLIPDRPGELARLFNDCAAGTVNIEEVSLEHAPGQELGLAQLSVLPSAAAALDSVLVERGWRIVG